MMRLPVGPFVLLLPLLVAVGCSAQNQPGEPPYERQWIKVLGEPDTERRVRAAQALGSRDCAGRSTAISALLRALKRDAEPAVRVAAAGSLGTVGDQRAIGPLVAATTDRDWQVRSNAVRALGNAFARHANVSGDRVVPAILAAAGDPHGGVRTAAAEAMATVYGDRTRDAGPRMNAAALVLLRDEEPDARQGAAGVLGRTMYTTSWAPLVAAMKDDDAGVRCAATSALGNVALRGRKSGFRPDRQPLLDAMGDAEPTVRLAAAQSLGRLGEPKGVPVLIRALSDDPGPRVRAAAAAALGETKDDRALPPLIAALEDRDRTVADAAVKAVVRKGAKAVPALLDAMKRARPVHATGLARALDKLRDYAAEPLCETLDDEAPEVRESAARMLGFLRAGRAEYAKPATERLAGLARGDKSLKVRAAALDALGTIGSKGAAPVLIEALRHEAGVVREAAAQALGYIKPQQPSALVTPPSGDSRAVAPLIAALEDSRPAVRRAAADSLKILRHYHTEPHRTSLRELLQHADAEVRGLAVEVLGGFRPLATAPVAYRPEVDESILRAALKDPHWRVRREAARRLSIPAATELMQKIGEHDEVRLAAAERVCVSLTRQMGPEVAYRLAGQFSDLWRDTANSQRLRLFAWRAARHAWGLIPLRAAATDGPR